MLFEEAQKARVPASLATVYNSLKQFTEVGLVRQIAADGRKSYFDTDLTDHHHFLVQGEGEIIDIPCASLSVSGLPATPAGYVVKRVEVVVQLRRFPSRNFKSGASESRGFDREAICGGFDFRRPLAVSTPRPLKGCYNGMDRLSRVLLEHAREDCRRRGTIRWGLVH